MKGTVGSLHHSQKIVIATDATIGTTIGEVAERKKRIVNCRVQMTVPEKKCIFRK
jgi:hypothetical protein